MEAILDFSKPLDVALLDEVYKQFNMEGNPQIGAVITAFQNHPDAWTRVDAILDRSTSLATRILAANILQETVKTRWKILPNEQRAGIKAYVVNLIIKLSGDLKTLVDNRQFLTKLNGVLVQIVKQEWPDHWPNFIPELVNSSKTSQSLCANNMSILMLMSEEVFDFASGQMTADKMKMMKQNLNREFTLIFQLVEYILDHSTEPTLLTATLQTLLRFLHWIPIGYIFETKLISTLALKFFPVQQFHTDALKCLSEIGSLKLKEEGPAGTIQTLPGVSTANDAKYNSSFVNLFLAVISQSCKVMTPETDIAAIWAQGATNAQEFIKHLAIFITSYLKSHIHLVETESDQTRAALGSAIQILLRISRVDDNEVFKVCLEYWIILVTDLYNTQRLYIAQHGSRLLGAQGLMGGFSVGGEKPGLTPMGGLLNSGLTSQTNSPRLQMYLKPLQELRYVMISKMARPEEVLIVEEEGEIVRAPMKEDTDALILYKCWGAGTLLLMFDGSTKKVEEIVSESMAGAPLSLMGDDGTARTIVPGSWSIGHTGDDFEAAKAESNSDAPTPATYRIDLGADFQPFTCNGGHILVLRFHRRPVADFCAGQLCPWQLRTLQAEGPCVTEAVRTFATEQERDAALQQLEAEWQPLEVECSVEQFLRLPLAIQQCAQMFQPRGVQFSGPARTLAQRLCELGVNVITPSLVRQTAWMLGMALSADERAPCTDSQVTKEVEAWHVAVQAESKEVLPGLLKSYGLLTEQRVPLDLVRESVEVRRALLAGLIDGEGTHLAESGKFQLPVKDGVVHLCRSLGLSATGVQIRDDKATCENENEVPREVRDERVLQIGGSELHLLPTVSLDKRASAAASFAQADLAFTVTQVAHAAYYGFGLDGNRRCLTGDYVCTHNCMREALIYLTHLDPNDAQETMLKKLDAQVDTSEKSEWGWNALNTLCWAIGSISGALSEQQEKTFLVRVIKDLLGLCEMKRGKDNKAVIASNIMYVVGQYPRFLRMHWKFLKTVVNKLIEFMHELHPGVQDMAVDTFLKISKKCRKKFVQIQPPSETRPFIEEILENMQDTTRDLQPGQIHVFYEAVGEIIQSEVDPNKRQNLVFKLMELPNQDWSNLIATANHDAQTLFQPATVKRFILILKTNNRVAGSLGPGYIVQLARIYVDMLQVYKMYSGFVSVQIQERGPIVTREAAIRSMRCVKKETLNLIRTFVTNSQEIDRDVILNNFIPALLDPVLDDYARNVPDARDAEVLLLFAEIITKLGPSLINHVARIFESVFQVTLDMINKNFEEYPEHRIFFFKLIQAINRHAFPALLKLNAAQFQLVMDSVIWAMKHLERNIADTGLQILFDLVNNVTMSEIANDFYRTYFISLLQDILGVLTDTFHKPGFRLQSLLLQKLFSILEQGVITVPLWVNAQNPNPNAFPNNMTYVRTFVSTLLLKAFPNLTAGQVDQFVLGLFTTHKDMNQFKTHLRDFLVQLKEFGGVTGTDDLFIEERRAQEEAVQKSRQDVPGLVYTGPAMAVIDSDANL